MLIRFSEPGVSLSVEILGRFLRCQHGTLVLVPCIPFRPSDGLTDGPVTGWRLIVQISLKAPLIYLLGEREQTGRRKDRKHDGRKTSPGECILLLAHVYAQSVRAT